MALTYDLEKHMAQIITSFEKTFIEESNLDFPLKTMEVFPIVVEKNQQVKTNKKNHSNLERFLLRFGLLTL